MRNERSRLALVVDPAEPERYPAHDLLSAALDEGWTVELLYDRAAPRIRDVISLLRAAARRPREVMRATRPQTAPPGRRLRLTAVMFAPQLLHLPSLESAVAWIALAQRLQARTLVNVGSEEMSAAAFEVPDRYRCVWSSVDAFHVETEALAGLLSRQGVPAHRIAVVPPAVDQQFLEQASRSGSSAAGLRILSVGPLSWTHCYEHAIQAVRLLHDRGMPAEYRIVGRGAQLDELVFAIHELGLREHVGVIESCTQTELRSHMRWAEAFVQAAVAPSSSKSILDAQAAGVPVITTAPPDQLAASVLAVSALDSSALAHALLRLQHDGALRMSLVAGGRERARRAPTSVAQTRRFRELHRVLVANG